MPKMVQDHTYRNLGSVYTRTDPFGTGTKLVEISIASIRDQADPLQIDSLNGFTCKSDLVWNYAGPG